MNINKIKFNHKFKWTMDQGNLSERENAYMTVCLISVADITMHLLSIRIFLIDCYYMYVYAILNQ